MFWGASSPFLTGIWKYGPDQLWTSIETNETRGWRYFKMNASLVFKSISADKIERTGYRLYKEIFYSFMCIQITRILQYMIEQVLFTPFLLRRPYLFTIVNQCKQVLIRDCDYYILIHYIFIYKSSALNPLEHRYPQHPMRAKIYLNIMNEGSPLKWWRIM